MSGPYSDKVMQHFMNPHNVGEIPDADGIGRVGNPICGDIMAMYIKVKDGIIIDAKFKTFGCLPPQEEIVSQLGGWEEIAKVNQGDWVINNEGVETRVIETYERDYRGELLKIVPFVSPYNSFSLTPNHPVRCIKRKNLSKTRKSSYKCDWLRVDEKELLSNSPQYIPAQDLEKGDYLVFVVNREVKDNPDFTKEWMQLLGYYLAEGYITAGGSVVNFSFNKNEEQNIEKVKDLVWKLTGKRAKARIRNNVCELYICSRKLARIFVDYCGKYAREKGLNRELLYLPFAKQWEMVKTYLAGDGDLYRRRPKDSRTYRIITTSKNLAIQIQEILGRGGIFASVREVFKPEHVIEARKIKPSWMFVISFKLKRRHKFVKANEKFFLVPIRKIETNFYDGPVYNFQVWRDPHSYLIKGFAVHNCGAAIATSSMATDLVKGKTIEEALKITNKAVAEALDGLPPVKMHCSVLAEQALQSAIDDYLKKTTGKGLEIKATKHQHDEHEGEEGDT
jgi:NifU-like protein involved in Fe-S cluster formation